MQEYGETWRFEFDLETIANSSVFNTVINVRVNEFIGGVGHPILPKIDVRTDPTLEFRVQCYQNGANMIKNVKVLYLKGKPKHVAIEQVYDRKYGKFMFRMWLNDQRFIQVWNKEPKIFDTASVYFGGASEDEVKSLSTLVIKNIKLCNGNC